MSRYVVDRDLATAAASTRRALPPLPAAWPQCAGTGPQPSKTSLPDTVSGSPSSFFADRRGAIAPVIAAFLPVAFGMAGLAVDISNSFVEQNRLQTAVDEATLVAVQALPDEAAARAAAIRTFEEHYNTTTTQAQHGADDVEEKVSPTRISIGRWNPTTREVVPVTTDNPTPNAVALNVNRLAAEGKGLDTFFLSAVGIKQLDLAAGAVAQQQGGEYGGLCVLALEPTAGKAVHIQGNASLIADECRIQVNSTAGNAIQVTGGAGEIAAGEICVAGGAQNSSRMSPAPETGCAAVADPLADFIPPSIGTCDHFGFTASGGKPGSLTLQPGVYCGGLTIKKSVTMAPGIYVIKDGPFVANGNVQIDADGVVLRLAGADAVIDLTGPVDMDHKAPKTGPFAGIAIYQDASVPDGLTSRMGQGNSTTRIVGTIYLPDQHLSWGGTPGTALPPWTLLVARTLYVFGTADLRIEQDFDASDVPPPSKFDETKKAKLVN
jgi:Flp pilus assembly protein TadG